MTELIILIVELQIITTGTTVMRMLGDMEVEMGYGLIAQKVMSCRCVSNNASNRLTRVAC